MKNFLKILWASAFGSKEVDTNDKSPKLTVDQVDIAKVVRNTVLAALAASLTYLMESPEVVAKYGPISVVVLTAALDFLKKFMKNNQKEV